MRHKKKDKPLSSKQRFYLPLIFWHVSSSDTSPNKYKYFPQVYCPFIVLPFYFFLEQILVFTHFMELFHV